MTIKTVLAAGWGLLLAASLHAQNQTTLPPTVQQHLKTGAPQRLAQLERLLKPVQPAGVQERGGAPRLDSVVLFSNYTAVDSFAQSKTVFEYPSAQLTVQTEYVNAGDWLPFNRTTQKTDALGRTTEALGEAYDPDAGVWVPESRVQGYPHGSSLTLVDSFTLSVWDETSATWQVAIHNETSFDNQDRPVAIFTHFAQLFGSEFSFLDELSYNAEGDNDLTIQSVEEQGEWTPFTRIERAFDQHREVLSTSYAIADSTTFIPQNKTETEYTPAGQTGVVRDYTWDFMADEWLLEQTTGYLYDDEGRTTSQVNDIADPDNPERKWIQYEYNTNGDLFVEVNRDWDFNLNTWVLLDKSYYYYSNTTAGHEVTNDGPLAVSPNPTTGFVRLPATEKGKIVVLNIQGQSVQPAQVQLNNGQIDISNLPAGLYYISVQEGSKRRTGAIVKQ